MNTRGVLEHAAHQLMGLRGHIFDVLTISEPISPEAATNLAKIISKLSPILGNLIEFNTVEFLNDIDEFRLLGEWFRQDPGFPDTVFIGEVEPTPGFEIKAWFPLATEITARFKDSQNHFQYDETDVCMLAWLPEYLIYGKPVIVDVCVVSGLSVAQARDNHYHKPPDYLVIEPEDTTARTSNLQQTNTNGYKWQGTRKEFAEAQSFVQKWGAGGKNYSPHPEYQLRVKELMGRYNYRLDTNFAKMDRIGHEGIEDFKSRVLASDFRGMSVQQWGRLFRDGAEAAVRQALTERLEIKEVDSEKILK